MHTVVRSSLLALAFLGLSACSVLSAPSVANVDAQTVASLDVTTISPGDPTLLTIRGDGFGDRQGLSRLFYAGFEVPADVVSSWSDGTIELAYLHPQELLGATSLEVRSASLLAARSIKGPSTYVAPEDQRFEVRTLGGSVSSEPVRLVTIDLNPCWSPAVAEPCTFTARATDLFGIAIPDLALAFASNRGTLADTTLTTDVAGLATTTLTIESELPHAVRVSFEDRPVVQGATLAYDVDPRPVELQPDTPQTVNLTLSDRGDVPSPAADLDLTWTLFAPEDMAGSLVDLGVHVTNAEGTASVPIPALPYDMTHRLVAVQDGFVVAETYLDPIGAGPD